MAILIAIAGIIIPVLPGIIGRAETSARATNDSEIYKWIQTYEATTSAYPYDWDALIDNTGAPIGYVSGFTNATPPLAVTSVTGNQVSALHISRHCTPAIHAHQGKHIHDKHHKHLQ